MTATPWPEVKDLVAKFLGHVLSSEESRWLLVAHAAGSDLLWRRPEPRLPSSRPVVLKKGIVTIGTAASASIRVVDRWASHRHVELESDERRWFAHDMNSTSGTRVAGEYITGWHRVRHGNILELGSGTAFLMLQMRPPPKTLDPAASFLPEACLTKADKRTLRGLAEPLRHDLAAAPASDADIARHYGVSTETIKSDMARLRAKAGLSGPGHRRRFAERGLAIPPHETGGK